MALETGLESDIWNGVDLVDREHGLVGRDIYVDSKFYAVE